jgi:hypothetical protein
MITTGAAGAVTQPRYEALTPRVRRRLTLLSLLRALTATTVLVVLFYVLPLDSRSGVAVSVGLAFGLLAFAAVVVLQVWQIARSDYPRLRAVEALTTAVPLFLLVFAATYFLLSRGRVGSFSEPLTRTNALYYTLTVFSTVGFGDITPKTEPARVVTMLQMVADLMVFGVVARVLVGAVSAGLRNKATTTVGR